MTRDARKTFEGLNLAADSNVAVFKVENDTIILDEAYHIHESSNHLNTDRIGFWTPKVGLVMTLSNIWERRNNLQGIALKGVIVHVTVTPYCCLWTSRSNEKVYH